MRGDRPAILLIGDSLNFGGTEGQFVEVACRLDRARWNVHVSCLRAEGPLRQRLEAAGLSAWSCGRGSFRSPRVLGAVWRLARYLRVNRIQLVHSFDFYSNVLGVTAAKLAAVPAVIASQRDLGDMRSGLARHAQALALRLATTVLVNAEAIRKRLVDGRIVAPERVELIPNGTDLARFAPSPRARVGGPPFVVGTVANLRPEKGLDDLLRAAALVSREISEVRFVIWGDGGHRRPLEALARELGVDGLVTFPGHTAAVQDALREIGIFVFPPRLNEGFSNALLEALAVGLPVVATRVGGNAELVEDERTGLLVPPGDPSALAVAVLRLLREPALAAALAERGRQRVRAQFGIEQMLARIDALYDRSLSRRAA